MTPLFTAADKGHDKVVSVLIKEGKATVDLAMKDGETALHAAAEQGYRAVVELLLKHGADRTATTKDGNWTARKLAELKEESKWGDAFWQQHQ